MSENKAEKSKSEEKEDECSSVSYEVKKLKSKIQNLLNEEKEMEEKLLEMKGTYELQNSNLKSEMKEKDDIICKLNYEIRNNKSESARYKYNNVDKVEKLKTRLLIAIDEAEFYERRYNSSMRIVLNQRRTFTDFKGNLSL